MATSINQIQQEHDAVNVQLGQNYPAYVIPIPTSINQIQQEQDYANLSIGNEYVYLKTANTLISQVQVEFGDIITSTYQRWYYE